jgi:hypothetical protein
LAEDTALRYSQSWIRYQKSFCAGSRELLRRVETWPQEDQEELVEVAREIEARRTGIYLMSDEEKDALDEALKSRAVPDEEIAAFWKRHGVV